MSEKSTARRTNRPTHVYYPDLVPMSAIRRYVRSVVQRFRPERVILFGSYSEGNPTADSDVDLLVIMPAKNELEQALKIDEALQRGFALDLIVRTPHNLRRRLRWGDLFLQEVIARGKVLYEKADRRVGRKGPDREEEEKPVGRETIAPKSPSNLHLTLPVRRSSPRRSSPAAVQRGPQQRGERRRQPPAR